jgi:hypothetical protein
MKANSPKDRTQIAKKVNFQDRYLQREKLIRSFLYEFFVFRNK